MKSSITIDRAFMTARINALATKKIFWSEVDFQLALAWEIKQTLPEADICLERRYMNDSGEPMYIDVCVTYQGRLYPIELKYKTRQVEIPDADNQLISLKAHGACDLGRYGFLKDIARIENLSKKENFERGFAIILTNDPLYYTANQRKSVDIEFKIHEGKTVGPGTPAWRSEANWTKEYPPLTLSGTYTCHWFPYDYPYDKSGAFKVLICEIEQKN